MSEREPKKISRRNLLRRVGVLGGGVALGIGISKVLERILFKEPTITPQEFIEDFDRVLSLLEQFEGTQVPYADPNILDYRFGPNDKRYILFKKIGNIKRVLNIQAEFPDPTMVRIYPQKTHEVFPSHILRTTYPQPFKGLNSYDEKKILTEEEIASLDMEFLKDFLEWSKTAPRKEREGKHLVKSHY